MTLRRLSAVCIVAAAAFLLPAPHAAAQFGLPRDVVTAQSIGPQQSAQIDSFVADWLPRIASDDPLEIKRARDMLLSPLREQSISVAFRQAYGERLVAGLTDHARTDRDLVVANALRIAGELATPGAVQLLEQKLRDGQAPIRLAAVVGIRSAFAAIRDASPAIGIAGVQGLVQRTGEQLRNEKSPEIVDACIRALASAMDITRQGYESVRPGAFQQITSGIGERAKRLGGGPDDAAMLIPMIRAAQIARDALSLQDVRLQLSDQSVRHAAELGGHLLAYAVRGVQAKAFAQDDSQLRDQVATVIQLAESTIILAAQRARIAQPPLNLAAEFKKGTDAGDRAFFQQAVQLLSVLTRDPFGFAANHFLQR